MYSVLNIVNGKNELSSSGKNSSLRDGSVVQARVLSKEEGNFYGISFSGHKFKVLSQKPLTPGQVFKARLSVREGKIFLRTVSSLEQSEPLQVFSRRDFDSSNPVLKQLLSSLGLPVIPESLKLLQFALETGIKLNPAKARKAFLRGQTGEKNDSQKSQLALLLEEKGFSATDFAVEAVERNFFCGGGRQQRHNFREEKSEKEEKTSKNEGTLEPEELFNSKIPPENISENIPEITADDIKEYFDSIFSEKEEKQKKPEGTLALFNSVLAKNREEAHWIVLPFEWDFGGFSGVIRVLLSSDKKNVNKVLINCKNFRQFYSFMLYLRENKVNTVKFALKDTSFGKNSGFLEKKLKTLFPEASIGMVDFSELEGFAAENTEIGIFDGEA